METPAVRQAKRYATALKKFCRSVGYDPDDVHLVTEKAAQETLECRAEAAVILEVGGLDLIDLDTVEAEGYTMKLYTRHVEGAYTEPYSPWAMCFYTE